MTYFDDDDDDENNSTNNSSNNTRWSRTLFAGVKRQGRGVDHSLSFSDED